MAQFMVTTKDRALITRINAAIANQASLKLSRVVEKRAPTRERSAAAKGAGKVRGRTPNGGKAAGGKRVGAKRVGAKPAGTKPSRTKPSGRKSPGGSRRKGR